MDTSSTWAPLGDWLRRARDESRELWARSVPKLAKLAAQGRVDSDRPSDQPRTQSPDSAWSQQPTAPRPGKPKSGFEKPETRSPQPDIVGEVERSIHALQSRVNQTDWLPAETRNQAHKGLDEIADDLNTPPVLSFVGNFSVGKSAVINSLIDPAAAGPLPEDSRASTRLVTWLRYGPRTQVWFHLEGEDEPREGDLERLRRLADHTMTLEADEQALLNRLSHISVEHPADVLRKITIVDTPGYGTSEKKDDDAKTDRHIHESDVLCWVFDADEGGGKKDEIERLRRLKPHLRHAFALINKCDKKPPNDRLELKRRLKRETSGLLDGVFLYSAIITRGRNQDGKEYEWDDEDRTHLDLDLVEQVRKRCEANAAQSRAERARRDLAQVAEALEQAAQDQKAQRAATAKKEQEKLSAQGQRLRALADQIKRLERKFEDEAKTHLNQLRQRLEGVFPTLGQHLRSVINVKEGFFTDDYTFNEQHYSNFRKRIQDSLKVPLEKWKGYIASLREHKENYCIQEMNVTLRQLEDDEVYHLSLDRLQNIQREHSRVDEQYTKIVDLIDALHEGFLEGFREAFLPAKLLEISKMDAPQRSELLKKHLWSWIKGYLDQLEKQLFSDNGKDTLLSDLREWQAYLTETAKGQDDKAELIGQKHLKFATEVTDFCKELARYRTLSR